MRKMYKKIMALSAFTLATIGSMNAQCSYTVNAYDSWGDGWNGGMLTINVNGTPQTYTLSSGSAGTYNFTVNTGDALSISYASGAYTYEVTYNIVNNVGGVVVNYPSQGTFNGVVYSGTAQCVTCGAPTNLNATNITDNAIDMNWDAAVVGALSYEVEYGPAGFSPGTGTTISGITSLTTPISGLTQVTNYQVYVTTICSGEEVSAGPYNFLTLPSCASPSPVVTNVLDPETVQLTWAAGANGETQWIIEYGVNGFTLGTGTQVPVTPNPTTTISNLTENTAYSFYVRGVCSVQDSSLWIGPSNVTTPLWCPNPSNLSATVVADTAFLAWTPGTGGESEWNIQYGPTGFTLGTGTIYTTTSNAPDTLAGLNTGTAYQYYVQAACASGDNSTFVGPFSFVTTAENDVPCNAIVVAVDGVTNTFGNYGSTNTSEPGNSSNQTVWFQFTVPASGHVAIGTCGTPFDTEISVFETGATCSDYMTFSEISYADYNPFNFASCTGVHPAGLELCGLTPGETHYFKVGNYYSGQGYNSFPLRLWDLGVDAGVGATVDACVGDTLNLIGTVTGTIADEMGYFAHTGNPFVIFNDTLAITGNIPANGEVIYVVENTCMADTAIVTINVAQPASSGTAMFPFTACNTGTVYLPDALIGTVTQGGVWTDNAATGNLNNNQFDATGLIPGTYHFTYTVGNGGICPPSSTIINVDIDDCLSIEENDLAFAIYPNPNNGQFFVSTIATGLVNFEVMDMTGKVLFASAINMTEGVQNEISLSTISTGMYIVKMSSESGVSTQNMIIK